MRGMKSQELDRLLSRPLVAVCFVLDAHLISAPLPKHPTTVIRTFQLARRLLHPHSRGTAQARLRALRNMWKRMILGGLLSAKAPDRRR